MKFVRMGHLALQVKDIEKSKKFYGEILGLQGRWTKDADWANFTLGHDDLSLVQIPGAVHPPHFGFRVENLDALKAAHLELKAKKIDVEEIVKHRDGSYSFYFKDPDNHDLEALWDPNLES